MFKRFREQFMSMNLDKKLRIFIFSSIVTTALIILFASTISYINLTTGTSLSLINNQLHDISDSLSNTLSNYKDIAVAVTLDDSVQQYLRDDGYDSASYYALQKRTRHSLSNVLNISNNMNFISVIKQDLPQYIYTGTSGLTNSQFYERFHTDNLSANPAGSGVMRVNFESFYYNNDPYAISIYHPIYDTRRIGVDMGTLCFSMREPILKQLLEAHNDALNYQLFLIDGTGKSVSSSDHSRIGQIEEFSSNLISSGGQFEQDGQVYIYVKLEKWNFYVAAAIEKSELYKDAIPTVLLLIVVIVLLVVVSLLVGTRILKRSYQSMNDIVYCMDQVSAGRFDVFMNEQTSGTDFVKIARGFNHMTRKVEQLMQVVKEEQHQIEQIKFNALQSQIKPHFLYNVLECIHWQAAMDGNQKISQIVKSLAEYYRVCLSGGRDIIELSEELRHITSYITIQNIRYSDIVTLETQIAPELASIKIPKMTLQPLVENSIYHGIRIKEGKYGKIFITARRDGNTNIITVEDDGGGMSQSAIDEMNESISVHDESFGYGVRNVHKRIELLFGTEYGLFYRQSSSGGLTVEIRLPRKSI